LRQRSFPNDAEVIPPLRPLPHEIVIKKRGAGPFGLTSVDRVLRSLDIEYLIIGGAVTHQCVEMTIRGASDFGYKAIMVDDGTATISEELQRNTVIALADWFCKVRTTDEILSSILLEGQQTAVLEAAPTTPAMATTGG
jgi:nicotinamidase-related amidase